MKIIGKYKNGNCFVTIWDDGTKERFTKEDDFKPDFPENFDMEITKKCDGGCEFCYQSATPNGKHAELLDVPFFSTLKPFTEIAINGNSLDHPQLVEFLTRMRDRHILISMTVNQTHFERNLDFVRMLVDEKLIRGLGISLNNINEDFILKVKQFDNAVIHVINGIVTLEDMNKLSNNNLKILMLGYKDMVGRGETYYKLHNKDIENKKNLLSETIMELVSKFRLVSFDNLALKQLYIKGKLSEEQWNNFYMGDDGEFSLYVNLVEGTHSKSSLMSNEKYPIENNIIDMFKIYKNKI